MVGSPLVIQCTVDTDGMDLGTVMISWMGPGGDTITSDSRVTISGTYYWFNEYPESHVPDGGR